MKNINLKELDNISKTALIILVAVIGYFLIFLITSSLSTPTQAPMVQAMSQMMGTSIMSFSTANSTIINLVSLVFGVGLGFIASLYLFKIKPEDRAEDREYKILRRALSEDEKAILDEIKKAEEITQDSLRFRLDWSKAKVSTILTNLDKRGLIQRERIGKTYKVYLQKSSK